MAIRSRPGRREADAALVERLALLAERKQAGIEPGPAPLARSFGLREAMDAFAGDVLGGYDVSRCWTAPIDKRGWSGGRTTVDLSALWDHFAGFHTVGAAPLMRSIVIDVDLPTDTKTSEAPVELKHMSAALVAGLLRQAEIPFLAFDSRRGPHTWIRCTDNPPPELLAALRKRMAEELAVIAGTTVEVRPRGGQQMRLPLGVSFGIGRGPLSNDLDDAALLAWLAEPPRATAEQLGDLFAQIDVDERPADQPSAPRRANPHRVPAPLVEDLQPPIVVEGWQQWCACKQSKFVTGLERAGERHWTYLMLAAEAALHAELSVEQLVALQLALPLNERSQSSESDLRIDAHSNARSVLAAKAANRPFLSGCPRNDRLRGNGQPAVLRATFQAHCSAARAARCPLLYAVWPRTTAYGATLSSSIWRSAQGNGAGLGMTARAIYEFAVERARGEPGTVGLSGRYLATKLPYITRNSAETALQNLCSDEVGLLRQVRDGTYTLEPARSAEALRQLEEALGTAALADAAIARHRNDWKRSRAVAQRNRPRPVNAETGR